MEKVNILGVNIDRVSREDTKRILSGFLEDNNTNTIYTPNTEIVMESKKNKELENILNTGTLVIPDGIGLIYASRIKKKPLPERVTGYDTSLDILEIGNKKESSVFLLGGEEGIAKKAGEVILEKYPNIKIVGLNNGYFKGSHTKNYQEEEEQKIIDKINKSEADILFIGFGAPKQEYWINKNKDKLNVKIIIGNGGTMDVLAGKVKRAPVIFQKLGLEWFYRLISEPSRIKRQLAIPKFILTIIFTKGSVK